MRPTVKDIARHAGVSPATVSLVLRNSPLVARPTRAGVQSSIDSLGYVYRPRRGQSAHAPDPHGRARRLRDHQSVLRRADGRHRRRARSGGLGRLRRQYRGIARAPGPLHRAHARAPGRRPPAHARPKAPTPRSSSELQRQGLPVVQMLRRVGRQSADYVSADFRLGMTLAAEHLIRLGHQAHRLRRRRPPRVAGARPRRGLSRDPAALRPAGRADRQLPADARGAARARSASCFRTSANAPDRDALPQRPLRLRRHARPRRPRPDRRPRLSR